MAVEKRRKYPWDQKWGRLIKRWYAPDRVAYVQPALRERGVKAKAGQSQSMIDDMVGVSYRPAVPEQVLEVYKIVDGKEVKTDENVEALEQRAAMIRAARDAEVTAPKVQKREKKPADKVQKRAKEPAEQSVELDPMYTDPQYLAGVKAGWVFRSGNPPHSRRYVWAKVPNRHGIQIANQRTGKWTLAYEAGYDRNAQKPYWHRRGKPGERVNIPDPHPTMPKGDPWAREVARVERYLASKASDSEKKQTAGLLGEELKRRTAVQRQTKGTPLERGAEKPLLTGKQAVQLTAAAAALVATGSPTAAVGAAGAVELADRALDGDAEAAVELAAYASSDVEAEIEFVANAAAEGEEILRAGQIEIGGKKPKAESRGTKVVQERAEGGDPEARDVVSKTKSRGGLEAQVLAFWSRANAKLAEIAKRLLAAPGATGEGHLVTGPTIVPNVGVRNEGGAQSYLVLGDGRIKWGHWSRT